MIEEAKVEKEDDKAEENISVAIYLAAYYHSDNLSCKKYL